MWKKVPLCANLCVHRMRMALPLYHFFLRKSIHQLQLFVHRSNDAAPFCRCPEQTQDVIVKSKSFHELGFRINFTKGLSKHTISSFYLGCKNIFNAYQSDFDSGKNRDSNYIYGPSQPRTFTPALKFPLNNPVDFK